MSNDERLGRLRADLQVTPLAKAGGRAFRVVDPKTGLTHEMWEIEHTVATLLDGQRSAEEVARACAARGFAVSAAHVKSFHRELKGMGFVVVVDAAAAAPDHRSDAQRFIDEANLYMAAGRYELAEGLFEAALQIDDSDIDADIGLARCRKMLAAAAAAGPAGATTDTGLFEIDMAEAPQPTQQPTQPTQATQATTQPPQPTLAPSSSTTSITRVAARGFHPVVWVLAGLLALTVAAVIVRHVLERAEAAEAAKPAPPPTTQETPPPPTQETPPQETPPAPAGPASAAVVKAEHPQKAAVLAPVAGRFSKVFVKPGARVLLGQKLLQLAAAKGPVAVVAGAAGGFVPAVPLGKKLAKGEAIGAVVDLAAWQLTARFDPPADAVGKSCRVTFAGGSAACSVAAVDGGDVVVTVAAADVAALTAAPLGVPNVALRIELAPAP